SNTVNIVVVTLTMLSLAFFVTAGFPGALANAGQNLPSLFGNGEFSNYGLLQATALMFVAYTGYGRIATLGEEVKEPAFTIPRAVIATLVASMILYVSVAFVGLANVGAQAFGDATREQIAPLQIIAAGFGIPGAGMILAVGAMTAMLGVVLNLLLGLSRVLFAMGRRSDMPPGVALVSKTTSVPWLATVVVAVVIGGLVLLGDVRLTWSFSAFTVLIYYAITNLCALRLQPEQRLYPAWIAWCGLAACLFLAFWVDWYVWLAGIGLIALGLAWHELATRVAARDRREIR
ncbi:MAG: APC family permease, partial [Pirellulaceae bacterium]